MYADYDSSANTPPDNRAIWRYRPLGIDSDRENRLKPILKGKLHFSRLDQLWDVDEGRYSERNFDPDYREEQSIKAAGRLQEQYSQYDNGLGVGPVHQMLAKRREQLNDNINYENAKRIYKQEQIDDAARRARKSPPDRTSDRENSFVNCWQMNEYESDVMWRSHDTKDSVAIKSTVGSLITVAEKEERYDVSISDIEYIDPEVEPIPEEHDSNLAFYKWIQYKHEEEVRGLITKDGSNDKIDEEASGVKVEIDPAELIEEVIVSPAASMETYNKVSDLCKSRDVPEVNVSRSVLTKSYQS